MSSAAHFLEDIFFFNLNLIGKDLIEFIEIASKWALDASDV